ncbi:MAG: hypothetical protein GXN99_01705, partial [Candidatus Nanohaloarchaeota archaeon]|nr:hypothetical protein [Candidatus Nanohaloarchaeota archaeon]
MEGKYAPNKDPQLVLGSIRELYTLIANTAKLPLPLKGKYYLSPLRTLSQLGDEAICKAYPFLYTDEFYRGLLSSFYKSPSDKKFTSLVQRYQFLEKNLPLLWRYINLNEKDLYKFLVMGLIENIDLNDGDLFINM